MNKIYVKDTDAALDYITDGDGYFLDSKELVIGGDFDVLYIYDNDNPYSTSGIKKLSKTVSVDAEGDNGTVYGSGEYAVNSNVTLFAVADDGYEFSSWSDEEIDNPRLIEGVDEDVEFTAVFTEIQPEPEPEEE